MKKYEVYRNIRKHAVIYGLPIPYFALQMIAILASLLVMIFSFRFMVVMGIVLFNALLYIVLIRMTSYPLFLQFKNPFPKMMSNKRNSDIDYEES